MGVLQDHIEHRRKVGGRRIDHFENFGSCRLLRAGLRELSRPLRKLALQFCDLSLIAVGRHLVLHPLPALPWTLARGSTTRNSVKAPGSVSTSMVPPCCLTMMSWLIESPSPVPSPAGFVVKK